MKRTHQVMLASGAAVAVLAIAAVGLAAAHQGISIGGLWGGGPEGSGQRPGFNTSSDPISGSFVTLSANPASGALSNIGLKETNSTHPLVASVVLANGATSTGSAVRGAYLLDDGVGDRVIVADSPRADIRAASVNGTTVTLTLPDGATIVTHDAVANWSPAGATVTYANGQVANLMLNKNATLAQAGQVLTVTLGPQGGFDYGIVPANGEHRLGGPGFEGFEHGERGGFGGHGGPRDGHEGGFGGPGRR